MARLKVGHALDAPLTEARPTNQVACRTVKQTGVKEEDATTSPPTPAVKPEPTNQEEPSPAPSRTPMSQPAPRQKQPKKKPAPTKPKRTTLSHQQKRCTSASRAAAPRPAPHTTSNQLPSQPPLKRPRIDPALPSTSAAPVKREQPPPQPSSQDSLPSGRGDALTPYDSAMHELLQLGVARDVAERALDATRTPDNERDTAECVLRHARVMRCHMNHGTRRWADAALLYTTQLLDNEQLAADMAVAMAASLAEAQGPPAPETLPSDELMERYKQSDILHAVGCCCCVVLPHC